MAIRCRAAERFLGCTPGRMVGQGRKGGGRAGLIPGEVLVALKLILNCFNQLLWRLSR